MARKTSVSKKIAAAAKKNEMQIRKAALETFCKSIHEAAQSNNGKLPYRYMTKFIQENKRTCPWLNRDIINSAFSRYKKKMSNPGTHSEGPTSEILVASKSVQSLKTSISDLTSDSQTSTRIESRTKGGRPVGSSIVNKRKRQEAIVMMKNDIAREYKSEVDEAKGKSRRVRNGLLEEIIQRHKKKRNLTDVNIPLRTICQRVVRNNLIVDNHHCGGHLSPLVSIDDIVVGILIQMSRIRECLTPSVAIELVNSLIEGQPIQKHLIEWKKKSLNDEEGKVGRSYWRSFLNKLCHPDMCNSLSAKIYWFNIHHIETVI